MRTRLIALVIFCGGCSLIVPGPGDLTPDQFEDGGLDATVVEMDGGSDADADGGADAAPEFDAGSCGVCEEPAPFCDPSTGGCVQCLENADCDDGDRCTVDRCSLGTCTQTPELRCVAEIVSGSGHTCARYATGEIACWGSNSAGQLGDGTTEDSVEPVYVTGLDDAVQVTASIYHTCAVRLSGAVSCWGDNEFGQLGNGSNSDSMVPVSVTGLSDAIEVSGGGTHTCARRAGGTVTCWGDNSERQLGNGSTTASNVPVPVADLTDVLELSAGSFAVLSPLPSHTCARRSDGTVVCWGANGFGQLGNGSTTDNAARNLWLV